MLKRFLDSSFDILKVKIKKYITSAIWVSYEQTYIISLFNVTLTSWDEFLLDKL